MREVMNWGEYGKTQLHFFCWEGMTSSVKRMLEMKSIDVEARLGGREDGDTCLMTAALHGHLDICRLLIDKGAQMEAKGRSGDSPLHYAAWEGSIEVVRDLCDRGADIEASNQDGCRPLHHAALNVAYHKRAHGRNANINA
jgi:ankyrin repeat protein